MSTIPLSDDDELLAAELAFGLLEGADRRAAETRLAEPAFADAHGRWQAHAAALASAGAGEAPRPSVWSAIEARLPANDIAPVAPPHRSTAWRTATLAATAAAIVLGVVAVQQPARIVVRVPVAQGPVAPMVAVLTGKKGFVTISFDPASGRIISATNGLDMAGHAPELWVIPADGKPRSMGVMKASAPGWAPVPAKAMAALGAGVTIAISVEPVGGSPTGQPTGPVILAGKMTTT